MIAAFSFLLSVLFIPGITGAGTTPRWALAAVCLPILLHCCRPGVPVLGVLGFDSHRLGLQLRESHGTRYGGSTPLGNAFTTAHIFGLLFLCYAALSLTWTPQLGDGLDALVKLVVIAEAVWLGSLLEDLKPIIIGFGLGMWVNPALMLLGVDIPHTSDGPAGLFVNSNVLGEIAALVLCAAVFYRGEHAVHGIPGIWRGMSNWRSAHSRAALHRALPLWWLIPGILPALYLSHCRSAFLAVAGTVVIWLWSKSCVAVASTRFDFTVPALLRWIAARFAMYMVVVLGGLGIGAVLLIGSPSSIQQRLDMWGAVLPQLTFFGHGLGSFYTLYPLYSPFDTLLQRPDHLHNDWLEWWFELGAIGIVLCAAFLWSARSTILAALTIEALFGFPLHMAATAVLGGIVAGHAVRGRAGLRNGLAAWRALVCTGHDGPFPGVGCGEFEKRGLGLSARSYLSQGISVVSG